MRGCTKRNNNAKSNYDEEIECYEHGGGMQHVLHKQVSVLCLHHLKDVSPSDNLICPHLGQEVRIYFHTYMYLTKNRTTEGHSS